MNKTGAWLLCQALEKIGVRYTFGIPGPHTAEIHKELSQSRSISNCLVSGELGAAFMADAVSRTSDHLGVVVLVPGAGVTQALTGIAEALAAGVPMLVIAGSVSEDSEFTYQSHDIDQLLLANPLTKGTFKIGSHAEIVPTLFEAYNLARDKQPGPVFVEIPTSIQFGTGEVPEPLPEFTQRLSAVDVLDEALLKAAKLLKDAQRPGLFAGWGAVDATPQLIAIAEHLGAPVCTTLQGVSAFPASHPLHTGSTFGPSAVPAVQNAFADCDCMLAVGTRFAEGATGSYGAVPPASLVHVDINHEVFNVNFPASVALCGNASQVLDLLLDKLKALNPIRRDNQKLVAQIAADKAAFYSEWRNHKSGSRVNPGLFFQQLREALDNDVILVTDEGNVALLTAELMPINRSRGFIAPVDFNAMGYCVPAANGVKIANPDATVIGITDTGAMRMTGMEALTAARNDLGVVYCLFNGMESARPGNGADMASSRDVRSERGQVNWGAFAEAMECGYILIARNDDIEVGLRRALETAAHRNPVIVEVLIDFSRATSYIRGVGKTHISRASQKERFHLVRALKRRITG